MEEKLSEEKNLNLAAIGFLYFYIFLAQNIWRSTYPNHAINNLELAPDEFRILLALTFIPGIFAFTFGYIATQFSLKTLLLTACFLVSIGLLVISHTAEHFFLYVGTFAIASGFTLSYIAANSAYLTGSHKSNAPLLLAKLKSFGPMASFTGAFIILSIFAPTKIAAITATVFSSNTDLTFQTLLDFFSSRPDISSEKLHDLFAAIGFSTLVVGSIFIFSKTIQYQEKNNTQAKLKQQLLPYYILNFLAGCRSAIFQAFALFVLIKQFQLPLHGTAFLGLCAYLCGIVGYRMIGYFLFRYSARNVLTIIYLIVALNFFAFFVVLYWEPFNRQETLLVLSLLFLIDSTFFGVSVVTDSHLKKTNNNSSHYMSDIAIGLSLFSFAAAFSAILLSQISPSPEAFLLGTAVCILAILTGRHLKASPT